MSPNFPSFLFALVLSLLLAPSSLAQRKTLGYNFTLAALNTTLPNANNTGVPLVLGSAGAITGASFYITSTYASYPYNDYPTLGLVNGALRAYGKDGRWITNASAISTGSEMGWVTSSLGGGVETDQYTALHATRFHRFASLAVHGQDALWSLCPSTQFRGKNEVVFNVSSTYQYYPFAVEDCYKVTLQVLPLHRWEDEEEDEGTTETGTEEST
ncbi:hypothetical protein HDZ31DRAFT_63320 [Schizophyllum fasciatum]